MSLCCRPCVSVLTCLCAAGPVSVCVDMSLCCRPCVSVLTCLCAAGPVSVCVDMSLCCRPCVSVLTCLCAAGPVSACWSRKPAGGSGQVSVSGQNAVHSLSQHLPHSSPPLPLAKSTRYCRSLAHSCVRTTCYETADSMVAAHWWN